MISSAIGPLEDNKKKVQNNNHLNHSLVKSSNQLLNRIMFFDKDLSDELIGLQNESMNGIEDERRIMSSNNERYSNHFMENSIEVDELTTTNNPSSHDSTNRSLNLQNGFRVENTEPIDVSDDSDIADALTQVIEEFSGENLNTSSESNSLEEEFICDVVNEINVELMRETVNIHDIVLIPPIGFRDECNDKDIVLTPPIGFRDK